MKSFAWKKTKTVFASLLYLSLFFFSDTVREAAAEAINNCLISLLPTVFPIMILSSWITALIMDGEKKRRKRTIAGLIFLALTGGYLIGSVLACDLYRKNCFIQYSPRDRVYRCVCRDRIMRFCIHRNRIVCFRYAWESFYKIDPRRFH